MEGLGLAAYLPSCPSLRPVDPRAGGQSVRRVLGRNCVPAGAARRAVLSNSGRLSCFPPLGHIFLRLSLFPCWESGLGVEGHAEPRPCRVGLKHIGLP